MARATTLLAVPLLVSAMSLLGGCLWQDVREQTAIVDDIGRVTGRVIVKTGKPSPVHAVTFRPGGVEGEFVIVNDTIVDPDGSFRMALSPGRYYFGAFQDLNGDGTHQLDREPANYFKENGLIPTPFVLGPSGQLSLPGLTVAGVLKGVPEVRAVDGSPAVTKNIGRVVSLGDPMFSAQNATMGLWRPVDFLKDVGGGLFMLQEYRADAIPVIFVHGIGGTPDSFAPLVDVLDRSRFQPWVLHYPSGLRLDVVSDYLDRSVALLQSRHHFKKLFVVAHSMGGLVARSFVMKHEQRHQKAAIELLMTINSPLLGMSSAAKGVDYSPVVVPAWRDVALNSEFVGKILAWDLPARISYHLVFSYQPGADGDGVVSLDSQIPLGQQDEAVRVYGFRASHAGVLADPQFLRHFETVMSRAGQTVPANAR